MTTAAKRTEPPRHSGPGKFTAEWQWKQVARALVCLASLQDAGFTGDTLREMAATWMAESGGKRLATHTNTNGTTDLGPAQLNAPLVIDGEDRRTNWAEAAHETKRLFDRRGFAPWYAHGTDNWLAQFPYVDAAINWLDSADRARHGW